MSSRVQLGVRNLSLGRRHLPLLLVRRYLSSLLLKQFSVLADTT